MESAHTELSFHNKVVLITGSTRGIGWATARAFGKRGATVLLNGCASSERLAERVHTIKSEFSVPCEGFLFDVADTKAVKDCYQSIFKTYKKLDVLVNNAGLLQDALLGMISFETIERTLAVNTVGALTNLQEAARLMSRKKQGSIINVTSIIGLRGNTGQTLYAASKAALVGMTISAAKELAADNIRVNAVAPGFIETDMAYSLPEDKFKERIDSIKMGRIGTAEEIANVILFLASDLASYVTGQTIGVDGGMLI